MTAPTLRGSLNTAYAALSGLDEHGYTKSLLEMLPKRIRPTAAPEAYDWDLDAAYTAWQALNDAERIAKERGDRAADAIGDAAYRAWKFLLQFTPFYPTQDSLRDALDAYRAGVIVEYATAMLVEDGGIW